MNTGYPRLSNSLLKQLREEKRTDLDLPPQSSLSGAETILQLGFGSFLRGFIADFVQRAVAAGDFHGRIVAVQRKADERVDHLVQQDGLYTLILRGRVDGKLSESKRVIGSISRVLTAETEWEKVLAAAIDPTLKVIVSNATEAGMTLDPADRPQSNPPHSFPGKLTQILYNRWRASGGQRADVAVIPCELIERNGVLVQSLVLKQAEAWRLEDQFSSWANSSVHFANTLVDRIVVGTPHGGELEREWESLGYEDRLIDCAEPFHLFALEADEFTSRHFPIDRASSGVRFVADLEPYRIRKVRILNGSHTALAAIGRMLGLRTVLEAMDDPDLGAFAESLIFQEIIPSINLADGVDKKKYAEEVLDRFRNPSVRHELSAICMNCSTKAGIRLFPSLCEYSNIFKKLPARIILGLAAVLLVLRDPEVQDAHGAYVRERWQLTLPASFETMHSFARDILAQQIAWSHESVDLDSVAHAVAEALFDITTRGMRNALKNIVKSDPVR